MSAPQTIVRMLTLDQLAEGIANATTHMRGVRPTRIVVSPTQMMAWHDEFWRKHRGAHWSIVGTPLTYMGVRVVEGARDQQPEFQWAVLAKDMIYD